MDPEPVIEWANGVQRLADLLGIRRQVVWTWRRDGRIPYLRACQVESISGGQFKAVHASDVDVPQRKASCVEFVG